MDGNVLDFRAMIPAFMRAQADDTALADGLTPLLRARASQLDAIGISAFLLADPSPMADADTAALLDSLAKFLGLVWWRNDWAPEVKLAMMRQAEKLRQLSETHWAFQTTLRAYFSDPALEVQEWFDYAGLPCCFRILTENAEAQEALRFESVVELIKRQSQQFEGMWAGFSGECPIYRAARGTDDLRLTATAS